jgi:hypothetical protein
VERTFAGIQSLLFEHLLGYQGVDVADRGVDPEADATLTIVETEHLLATWVVRVWQNRRLGEHAPSWDPGGQHSPNSLFAAAMGQGGFALTIPAPEFYYALLPAHYVKLHRRRGAKVGGLWYDGPTLDPYRDQPSTRGGRHKGKWVVRRDRRDCRFAYFQDPQTGTWQTLRWTGLPPDGEVPAFSDARVQEVLDQARRRGLKPRSDAELLPVLLDLLAGHVPVDRWPTQQRPKRGRVAREVVQAAAAARDRPPRGVGSTGQPATGNVVPLDATEHARQVQDAVDAERRRRREQAVPVTPAPPPRLGEASRRRSLLVLPPQDEVAEDPPVEPPAPAPQEGR